MGEDLHRGRCVEDKAFSFPQYITKQRKVVDYKLGQTGNMDKTLMTINMVGFRMLNENGRKWCDLTMKTTMNKKAYFKVILSRLAEGMKPPTMTLFKRKSMSKENLLSSVIITIQIKE